MLDIGYNMYVITYSLAQLLRRRRELRSIVGSFTFSKFVRKHCEKICAGALSRNDYLKLAKLIERENTLSFTSSPLPHQCYSTSGYLEVNVSEGMGSRFEHFRVCVTMPLVTHLS